MEQIVKHLKITEGKVFASSMEEPSKLNNFEVYPSKVVLDHKKALDQWNASFIEVENPEFLHFMYKPVDGLYQSPEGLEMTVKEVEYGHVDDYSKPHGFKKVAILSFTQSKEKESCQPNQCLYPNCNCSNPPKAEDKTAQSYFKLSTNEYGKHWLFYKPLKSEPGKYGCWMPIDDEFYAEFLKIQKAFEQPSLLRERIAFKGELILELKSQNDWVNKVPRMLPEKTRAGERFIFLDKHGHVLESGADFMAAEVIGSYPVRVYRPISVREHGK